MVLQDNNNKLSSLVKMQKFPVKLVQPSRMATLRTYKQLLRQVNKYVGPHKPGMRPLSCPWPVRVSPLIGAVFLLVCEWRASVHALDGQPTVMTGFCAPDIMDKRQVRWKEEIRSQFRVNLQVTDKKAIALAYRDAVDYLALLKTLEEHSQSLRDAGWGLGITDEQRRQMVSTRVGLRMPQVAAPEQPVLSAEKETEREKKRESIKELDDVAETRHVR